MAKISLHLFICVFALSFILPAAGCGPSGSEELDAVGSQLKELLKRAEKKIDGLAPQTQEMGEATSQELEKLFTFEYKVVEFAKDAPGVEIERELQGLGQDRWECFAAETNGRDLRVFCKRRPRTYLRYIPRLMP